MEKFSRDKMKKAYASSCLSYTSRKQFILIKGTVSQGHHVNAWINTSISKQSRRSRNKVAAMRPPTVGEQEGADLNEVLLDLKGQLLSGPLPYNGFPLPGWAGIKGQLQIPSTAFLINCTHKCKENGSCFSFQDRKSPRTWRYKNKVALHWLNHHKHYERPTVGPNQDFDQIIH